MNYYLVDFENVRTDGIKDLKGVQEGDAMIVFYSENCKSTTLDVLEKIIALNLKYTSFKVKVGSKNALDFQLTSYLGYLIGQGGENTKFYIVSEDKGFETVADFWREQNVSVSCISLKDQTPAPKPSVPAPKPSAPKEIKKNEPKEKKSKVASKDLATLEEIKTLIGKSNEPAEVLKVFNQYKTKVAINNGLAKYYKDSKKASEVYKKLKPLLKSKNKS